MSQFGRVILPGTTPLMTMVSADGFPAWKTGGITLDLTLIAAAPVSDVTLPDGTVIKANSSQYLRYGQILAAVTGTTTDTVTITGSPTGGTFTLSYGGQTTSALAYNAAAATVQTALNALSTITANPVTVTGSAGGPYTVVFPNSYGTATALTGSGASLTGGTSPAVAIANTVVGGNVGKYGPYDSAAIDGRQTLSKGYCTVLNETWMGSPAGSGFGAIATINPPVIVGGRVWKDRLLATTGSASLANGPTFTALEAALAFTYVVN